MQTYKEFLNESYLNIKNWANTNLSGFGKDDNEKARFYASAKDAGFTSNNDISKAWKSLLVHDEGVFGPAKKEAAPTKKETPAAPAISDAEIDKVSALWEAVAKAASAAGTAGRALSAKFNKSHKSSSVANSPEYLAWVASQGIGYQESIIKEVQSRKNDCKELKAQIRKLK